MSTENSVLITENSQRLANVDAQLSRTAYTLPDLVTYFIIQIIYSVC